MHKYLPQQLSHLASANWQLVTDGKSDATIYRIAQDKAVRYLKITAKTSLIPVSKEYTRLNWLQGKVPVPTIIDYAENATHQFLLMSECVGLHPLHDDLTWDAETRIAVLAESAKRFHAIDPSDCPYKLSFDEQIAIARKNIDTGTIDGGRWQKTRTNQSIEAGFTELLSLKPSQEDYVVTHGDMYPVNMRVDEKSQHLTGYIDVGRCAIADRYTDLAFIVNAIEWHIHDDVTGIAQFFALYGITPDEQKLRFYWLIDLFRAIETSE